MQPARKQKHKPRQLEIGVSDYDVEQLRHLLVLWARYKVLGMKGIGPQIATMGWYRLIRSPWKGVLDFEPTREFSESDFKRTGKAVDSLVFELQEVIKAENGVVIEPPYPMKPYYARGKSKRARARSLPGDIHESTYKDRLRLAEEQLVFELRGLWV